MMKKLLVKNYKKDLIILGCILVVGVLLLAFCMLAGKAPATVLVSVEGNIIAEYSLYENTEIVIEGKDRGSNVLVIENGVAKITKASCPDGLCMGMGPISREGQSMICLPNQVVVSIH